MTKRYGVDGVNEELELGNDGLKVKNDGDHVKITQNDGVTLAPIQVAMSDEGNTSATKDYTDAKSLTNYLDILPTNWSGDVDVVSKNDTNNPRRGATSALMFEGTCSQQAEIGTSDLGRELIFEFAYTKTLASDVTITIYDIQSNIVLSKIITGAQYDSNKITTSFIANSDIYNIEIVGDIILADLTLGPNEMYLDYLVTEDEIGYDLTVEEGKTLSHDFLVVPSGTTMNIEGQFVGVAPKIEGTMDVTGDIVILGATTADEIGDATPSEKGLVQLDSAFLSA